MTTLIIAHLTCVELVLMLQKRRKFCSSWVAFSNKRSKQLSKASLMVWEFKPLWLIKEKMERTSLCITAGTLPAHIYGIQYQKIAFGLTLKQTFLLNQRVSSLGKTKQGLLISKSFLKNRSMLLKMWHSLYLVSHLPIQTLSTRSWSGEQTKMLTTNTRLPIDLHS